MPSGVYEPLTGSPGPDRSRLVQCATRRERWLIVIASVAALAACLLLVTAVFIHMEYQDAHHHAELMEKLCSTTETPPDTGPTQEAPCTSPGCVRAAARILASMEPSVDPCQDFYRYSCGRFPLVSPRPSELASWTQFEVVDRRQRAQLSSNLQSTEPEQLAGAAGAVRRVFQQCANMTSRDLAGVAPLAGALERVGGWPALVALTGGEWNATGYSWSSSAVLAHVYTGKLSGPPLVRIIVSIDERNATRHLLHVDQPSLPMPRGILAGQDTHAELHTAYERLIADTLLLLLGDAGGDPTDEGVRTAAERAATEIRQFEVQLATLTVPDDNRRNISRMYNKMTLNELQQLTDQVQPGTISWTELVGEFLALGTGSDPPDGEMEVVVYEPDFFRNLTVLLNETEDSVLANYIGWRVALGSLAHLNSNTRQARFKFEKILSGMQAPSPMEQTCFGWLGDSMGPGLSFIFITNYFPDVRKDKVATMISDVGAAFSRRLDGVSWMDAATLRQAHSKVDQMVANVAYPAWMANATEIDRYYQGFEVHSEHFGNYEALNRVEIGKNVDLLTKSSDRHKYFGYPSVVNAFYEPTVNSITFPAAILAPPFYDDGLQVLNYGAIGAVIGHELTHGFDDIGSQFDSLGNLVSWWSADTRAEFTRRAGCVEQQYSNYSLPGLSALADNSHVNGLLTLGENIADNGGIARAYEAYFDHFASRHGPEPPLPALGNFTADQLFFISFAQIWCSHDTPEYLRSQLLVDPHSPRSVRVHGTVSNSNAFAAAFACPRGTPMNPEHKCVVW